MGHLTDPPPTAEEQSRQMATEQFHVNAAQAEAYEERFVPALFRQWVEPVLEAADVRPGDRVLDVACGTGVVARSAVGRAAPTGTVTGVDLNPAMLAVARRVAPHVDWREGDAAALPFPEDAFDVVTCQAAIFFFPDPTRALAEMQRVVRPGGRVVVQAFSSLAAQPAYGPWVQMVAQHAGRDAVQLLGTYWTQGDIDAMRQRCVAARLRVTAVSEHTRPAYFPDISTMVQTEVAATPLADRLDPQALDRIVAESQQLLARFVRAGRLAIPLAGYVLSASRAPSPPAAPAR